MQIDRHSQNSETGSSHICYSSLPTIMVIKNYAYNYPSDYELYLTELINRSQFFLRLSNGKGYKHLAHQSQYNGQYDCVSDNYSIDYKILGTKSSLYAESNLSLGKAFIESGIILTVIPKQLDGMTVARTNPLLKKYSLEDLERIDDLTKTHLNRNDYCEIR